VELTLSVYLFICLFFARFEPFGIDDIAEKDRNFQYRFLSENMKKSLPGLDTN